MYDRPIRVTNKINFDYLPNELKLFIYVQNFTVEELYFFAKSPISKLNFYLLRDNHFWGQKFKKHFPHQYKRKKKRKKKLEWNYWFKQYWQVYKTEYSLEEGPLHSLVKENDIGRLKKTSLNLKMIDPLLGWAREYGYQKILNYFYQIVLNNVNDSTQYNKEPLTQDKVLLYNKTELEWGVLCRQSDVYLEDLIKKIPFIYLQNSLSQRGSALMNVAVSDNNVTLIKALMRKNIPIYAHRENCPFQLAIQLGRFSIVRLFVESETQLSFRRLHNAIHLAAYRGYKEIVNFLMTKTENGYQKAIAGYIKGGYPSLAVDCLSKEAALKKADESDLFLLSIQYHHKKLISFLLREECIHKKSARWKAGILLAVKSGNKESIAALMQYKYEPNELSVLQYALKVASFKNSPSLIKWLIEELTGDKEMLNTIDCTGRTALCKAIDQGRIRLVKTLITCGADPSIKNANNGDTPLHRAAHFKNEALVRLLLKHKANPTLINEEGKKPYEITTSDKIKAMIWLKAYKHRKKFRTGFWNSYFSPPQQLAYKALKKVVFWGANVRCLRGHENVLEEGELGKIFSYVKEKKILSYIPFRRKKEKEHIYYSHAKF